MRKGRSKVADDGEVKQLLRAETTTAAALYAATKKLIGDFLTWEPESIWLELQHHGVDLPPANRAKLNACIALHLVPAFYWDAGVFEKTIIAFDHTEPNPDVLEEARPEAIAWGVLEAEAVRRMVGDEQLEFDSEPKAYAAVVLNRAGLVLAPDELSFCQDALDRLTVNDSHRGRVGEGWANLKVKDAEELRQHHFEESPVDVQLAHLAACRLYVRDKQAQQARELAALR